MSKKQIPEIKDDYTPFGPEWEKELIKFPKAYIIDMYRKKCLELQKLQNGKQEANRY